MLEKFTIITNRSQLERFLLDEIKNFCISGIVTAGTGIGSIIFGPLSRNLFDFLGWRIGLVALSVILSGSAFCCLTMKPVKPVRKAREQELKDLLLGQTCFQCVSMIRWFVFFILL